MTEPASEGSDPADGILEEFFWSKLRAMLELDQAQWTNLTRVVALHLVLDRLLTLTIVTRLSSGGGAAGIVETLTDVVAELSFGRLLLDLAAKAGWVPADVVADLREVNRVRNRLVHFDPRRKRFEGVPEIGSAKTFLAFTARGHHAYTGLVGPLLPLLEGVAEEEP